MPTFEDLLIVVPARGGSKGLPGKNLVMIEGRSLLRWTADAVRAARMKGATFILSTDDEAIAKSGRTAGIEVPFLRPEHLATDTAGSVEVMRHALEWARQERGVDPSILMLLQPTSPFRPPSILEKAVRTIREDPVDAVIGVKRIDRTLATLFHEDDAGFLVPAGDPARRETRRQDVRGLLTPNGSLYAVRTTAFLDEGSFFVRRTRAIEMGFIESLDLDDPRDLDVMRAVAAAGLTG